MDIRGGEYLIMATLDTVATRAGGNDFPAGKAYFETSTNKFIVWNGESWIELHSDGAGAYAYNIETLDTTDNILTSSPVEDDSNTAVTSYATDTQNILVFSDGDWYELTNDTYSGEVGYIEV